MAHIVIAGAGIGGIPLAYEAREKLGKVHDITVINASDEFQFLPSNPWLLVGWRQRDAISFLIAPYLEKKGIRFIGRPVVRIEAEHNRLAIEGGQTLAYDYLVITTGPKLAFDEVPGTGPHGGHTHSVCAVGHAQTGRQAYEAFCEDPGPILVGAMPAASGFGPVYESAFILDADLRKRKLRKHVPMTLVTSEPHIGHLGLGGVGDSQGLLESDLRNRHLKWITNAKTTRVEADRAFVEEYDGRGEVIKEHVVPFKFSMTLPAFRGVDPVAAVDGLCNPRGFVLIDANQRSPKYPNIFSAGVCVAIPPVEATPVPT